MSFNSLEFALFLPVFMVLFYALKNSETQRDIFILVASYLFYMSWYWEYAGLIALSTFVDYFVAKAMARSNTAARKKLFLMTSLAVNLGILGIFKYFNFFSHSIGQSLRSVGIEVETTTLNLLLPVGISFYTFQTLSYTIDVYRGKIEPENNFVKFAAYVSFFPQLVAGPIVRASVFLPQLRDKDWFVNADIHAGLTLIFIGLFKKIVIADLLAFLIVDEVFGNPNSASSIDLVVAMYAYAFQIYCDFSGYSDIAIGVALMMGFKLPVNFNKPYLAGSPSEFWKRWHITLSQWLRDYLYIPLGGNRYGRFRTSISLILTMLLGGLWHGAAWNFILWGAYHGLLLAIFRIFPAFGKSNSSLKHWMHIAITFHAILLGWLLFRISDMQTLSFFLQGLWDFSGGTRISGLGYAILLLAILSHVLPANLPARVIACVPSAMRLPVVSLSHATLLLLFVGVSVGSPVFIYFQF